MMTLLLVFLAAFFNSCMDAFENENFFESIFRKWNQKFWYKRESWKHARRIGGYPVDGWHLAKSAMIICVIAAGIMKYYTGPLWNTGMTWLTFSIDFTTSGITFITGFNLFYHKVFGIK